MPIEIDPEDIMDAALLPPDKEIFGLPDEAVFLQAGERVGFYDYVFPNGIEVSILKLYEKPETSGCRE